jgi:curved DNA-binding protein CbpA
MNTYLKNLLFFTFFCSILPTIMLCMAVKNYYAILGVPQDATQDDITKAYKKLALIYHPDKVQQRYITEQHKQPPQEVIDQATEDFQQLQNAYEALSNPVSRKEYDRSIGILSPEIQKRYDEFAKRLDAILAEHKKADTMNPATKLELAEKYFKLSNEISDYMLAKNNFAGKLWDLYVIVSAINKNLLLGSLSSLVHERLSSIQTEVQASLQEAKKITDLKAREQALDKIFGENELFFYADQLLRDRAIDEYIALINAYRAQKSLDDAKRLLNEAYNLVNTNWGKNFPISEGQYTKLDAIKIELGLPFFSIPENVISRINKEIEALKKAPSEDFGFVFPDLLKDLQKYKPASNAKIISLYLVAIQHLRDKKKLEPAKGYVTKALKEAADMDVEIKRNKWNMPLFAKKYKELQATAEELKKAPSSPQPSPTPSPASSLKDLPGQLNMLKQQLRKLNQQLLSF